MAIAVREAWLMAAVQLIAFPEGKLQVDAVAAWLVSFQLRVIQGSLPALIAIQV